ncbi:hypothetical protein GCM10022222_86150 [Amycolatopsis ultiminotia]|uniref:ATP/GTP-binding protein n=1 Tax=Amycolatopsis ultiminotia TaxID=543629 RepID=A0ABP6YS78_9PSEU
MATSGILLAHPGTAAADGQDDGQVIVTPSDPAGRYSPPGVDMRVLESQGEAPVERSPGAAQDRQSGAGGNSKPKSPSGLPPGCFLGGFGAGAGPRGNGPAGGAFGVRCMPSLREDPAPADAADAPPVPSPAELAAQAFEQLRLPLPVPRHSPDVRLPDGRAATIVGENTWLWTDRSVWKPAARRVQVGAVWAEVTAVPTGMTFTSGTGGSTSCSGPGTAYQRSFGTHAASPDCGFVYTRSSYGLPGEQARAEWSIAWSVHWTGSDGATNVGGDFPQMLSRASATFAVAEVQALRAR